MMYLSQEFLKIVADSKLSFGVLLRQKRLQARLSQDALAGKANNICTGAFISQIENNKYIGKKGEPMRPGIEIVDALANALDWSLAEARVAAGYAPPQNDSELESETHEIVAGVRIQLDRSAKLTEAEKRRILDVVKVLANEAAANKEKNE